MKKYKELFWDIFLVIFFWAILAIGPLLIYIELNNNNIPPTNFIETEGTVIDHETDIATPAFIIPSHRQQAILEFPIIKFQVDDQTYQFQSQVGYISSDYQPGSKAKIFYNPDNPEDARLTTFAGWNAIAIGIALTIIIFPLALIITYESIFPHLPARHRRRLKELNQGKIKRILNWLTLIMIIGATIFMFFANAIFALLETQIAAQ